VGGLAILTAHNRSDKDGAQDSQKGSVRMGRRKLKRQADVPLDEEISMNDGKHDGKTKAKMNAEKSSTRVRK
jgi:hypothetical protein